MADNRFLKGLFKDTGHIDQPKGTWRYALNMVVNTLKGAVSSEAGTSNKGELPGNTTVIGAIEISDGRTVLFLRTSTASGSVELGTGNPAQERSVIGVWESGEYKTLFNPNHGIYPHLDLKFSLNHLIEGTFKIDSKGDLVVYFTDDLNPPRAFNVSRQERSITFDAMGSPNVDVLYGLEPNDINLNQIYLLNLFPHTGDAAEISKDVGIHDGGSLRTGVYYLAIAYVGEDLVATNYMSVSNPVSIVEETTKTVPTNKIDGGSPGNQTSKSIEWNITNLNTVDYKYVRPVVIRRMGEATDVFKLNDTQIKAGDNHVVFSGTEGIGASSIEEVMIDTTSYDTAKTINQLDGVLYIGNTTGNKDIGYQKYANNIKLTSTTYALNNFDTFYATVDNLQTSWGTTEVNKYAGYVRSTANSPSYRKEELNSSMRGYMRGEVYAFYIAFILKDGSMSYAYHIPGRDVVSESEDDTYQDLDIANESSAYAIAMETLPSNAYYAQFWDFATSYANYMNYWKNLTEFYPDTENYDVFNGTIEVNSLRGTNVRHHAFPRNSRDERRSINESNGCASAVSDGTLDAYPVIDGAWRWKYDLDSWGPSVTKGSWMDSGFRFNHSQYNPTEGLEEEIEANTLFDGYTFTANQPMNLTISYHLMLTRRHNNYDGAAGDTRTRIKVNMGGNLYYSKKVTGGNVIADDEWPGDNQFWNCGDNCDSTDVGEANVTMVYPESAWTIPSSPSKWWLEGTLDTSQGVPLEFTEGDSFFIEGRARSSSQDWTVEQTENDNDAIGGSMYSWLKVEIDAGGSSSLDGEQFDAKIDHNVSVLGFHLDDIKIPKSLLSKVQGFRIYRAKRGHENKTILGQSVVLPMHKLTGQLGVCSEAVDNSAASHILSQITSTPEEFYIKHPWALSYSDDDISNYPTGYKAFSFHDFNLLRTQNSLAPATHIQLQYKISNYVWNGPSIQQDKKMLTKILNIEETEEILKFKEFWGHDAESNCYPRDVLSAIFIGGTYYNMDWYHSKPRMLGQKAKTYLLGDTIYSGASLGFGGKVFNEHGESCSIFGLRDGFELDPLVSLPQGDADDLNNTSFGYAINDGSANLINPNQEGRNMSYIANLMAYKSDVYKSIDSQELVYTGYEVLGDDLETFIFEDTQGVSGYGTPTSTSGDDTYTTRNKYPDGIYGGDTFICRYGFVSKVTPSNALESSNPRRGVHYHIVESSDNINFRHSEDDESLNFPGTSAKEVLSSTKDLSHRDNMRYNSNYSEDNNIKPVFPLPLRDTLQSSFPTRAHRSATSDTTSLIDNYRIFLANQYKDLPKNRGELQKLSSFNNLLYFHMESSLFASKGKQTMEMKDGTEAFIGSGDIFQQNPDEVIQTELGYGGTQSQWAAITTRYGYFFVDKRSGKVFLMGESMEEIGSAGMELWFKENLESKFTEYDVLPNTLKDNPSGGVGLHAIWDPKNKRILLTFRDLKTTAAFNTGKSDGTITFDADLGLYKLFVETLPADEPGGPTTDVFFNIQYNDTDYFVRDGWTISYYPEDKIWGSFHSYTPYRYFNTHSNMYSLTDHSSYSSYVIWEHGSGAYGDFYLDESGAANIYNFEFEFVDNSLPTDDTLTYSLSYTSDTVNSLGAKLVDGGFSEVILYNTMQMSEKIPLHYLVTTRRIGNAWKINKFRDMTALVTSVDNYHTPHLLNVVDEYTEGVLTSTPKPMFIVDGMYELQNLDYINLDKPWFTQRKFVDKWIGVRLICDNSRNNLVNLYSTSVEARKYYR